MAASWEPLSVSRARRLLRAWPESLCRRRRRQARARVVWRRRDCGSGRYRSWRWWSLVGVGLLFCFFDSHSLQYAVVDGGVPLSDNPSSPPGLRYHEVDAKSVLRRGVVVDPWFLGRFGSNLYRGCQHGCIYCDGRAERYYVSGEFDRDIQVKRNAVELAKDEIGRMREPGFLFIGGGVCDAYQPAEERYRLARGLLEPCR